VTSRGIARRYAGALFDVVSPSKDVSSVEREIASVSQIVEDHAELKQAFESPAVPAARKRAVLEAVLDAAGGVSPEVRRTLLLLADQDRLPLVGEVAAAFAERVRQARKVVPAEIITAAPLPEARRAALAEALTRAVGLAVMVTERVDPAIIGGVVARVGGVVFDGSVARQIERVREKLLSDTGPAARAGQA
jgi:F-type H+-transporting ATPase subunit delta